LNRNYRKGYRFEHRVKRYLERKGYKVFRIAGSKPIDLIALSSNRVYLIECKSRKRDVKKTIEKLSEYSDGLLAKPLIAYRKKNNRIGFIDIVNGEELKDLPDAASLEDYV